MSCVKKIFTLKPPVFMVMIFCVVMWSSNKRPCIVKNGPLLGRESRLGFNFLNRIVLEK